MAGGGKKEGVSNSEVGMRNAEKKKAEGGRIEVGSRTRRRPIRQDYAAAKDAASGLSEL
jgi:hypothetical protein